MQFPVWDLVRGGIIAVLLQLSLKNDNLRGFDTSNIETGEPQLHADHRQRLLGSTLIAWYTTGGNDNPIKVSMDTTLYGCKTSRRRLSPTTPHV